MRTINLFFILFTLSLSTSYAKVIHYEVRGVHEFKDQNPKKFSLHWTENTSLIQGSYHEDNGVKIKLKGKVNNFKRSFIITGVKGRAYKTLFVETLPIQGAQTSTIPLTVTFMDSNLKPIDSQNIRVLYHGEP